MSQQNVDTVKRIYEFAAESWRRRTAGEDDPVETIQDLWDPEVVVEEMPEFPDSRTYRGYDGLLQWWTAWFDVYDEITMEAREYIPLGDRVVVPVITGCAPRRALPSSIAACMSGPCATAGPCA